MHVAGLQEIIDHECKIYYQRTYSKYKNDSLYPINENIFTRKRFMYNEENEEEKGKIQRNKTFY